VFAAPELRLQQFDRAESILGLWTLLKRRCREIDCMPGVGGFEPRHRWRCPHAHSDNNNSRQPGPLRDRTTAIFRAP
jgi:hypothetical protein